MWGNLQVKHIVVTTVISEERQGHDAKHDLDLDDFIKLRLLFRSLFFFGGVCTRL